MRISRNPTKGALAVAAIALAMAPFAAFPAAAHAPSVASLDAVARASGNRLDVATRIGQSIFEDSWAPQISQISANEADGHLIVGIRLWGVKFHRPISRRDFIDQVAALSTKALQAAPSAEEVDVWASVPLEVGKGTVVSGDLARPTTRTVFSLTVHRGETLERIAGKADAPHDADVYWDQDWAATAFERRP
jgi:hypothetical protein